jgi:hypothetical protein
MLSLRGEERRHSCSIGSSVGNGKFGQGKPVGPIVLSMINEMSKEDFDFLIHLFGLTVCLWMICSGRVSFDSEKIIPLFDKLGYKDGSSIGYNVSGETESFENVIKEDSCPSFG